MLVEVARSFVFLTVWRGRASGSFGDGDGDRVGQAFQRLFLVMDAWLPILFAAGAGIAVPVAASIVVILVHRLILKPSPRAAGAT